jgi:transposase
MPIVADNLSTHKTKLASDYIDSVPGRLVIPYIPTHSSWLNLVERWFADITNKWIRPESWESVQQLKHAIKAYIKTWNKSGRKFIGTKGADELLAKSNKATSISSNV